MLRKMIVREDLEISQKNVYDGVFLVKLHAYSLQAETLL